MANFHSDEWIMNKLKEHYGEAKQYFSENQIIGIFLQGSQNYELDYESSDVDTKLIVVPSFRDIAMNKQAVSTTHVRQNDEHIDFKDIRLYMQTFRKQNLNFIEILFTKYKIINPLYADLWQKLVDAREDIARYDKAQALKSMQGVAKEKYFAMEHEYPSKVDILKQYGYDPKQLHHLLRIQDFIFRYVNNECYEDCMIPKNSEFLLEVKRGKYNLEEARFVGLRAVEAIDKIIEQILPTYKEQGKLDYIDALLDDIQYKIMKKSVTLELNIK